MNWILSTPLLPKSRNSSVAYYTFFRRINNHHTSSPSTKQVLLFGNHLLGLGFLGTFMYKGYCALFESMVYHLGKTGKKKWFLYEKNRLCQGKCLLPLVRTLTFLDRASYNIDTSFFSESLAVCTRILEFRKKRKTDRILRRHLPRWNNARH